MRARDVLGKFIFVPTGDTSAGVSAAKGARHLSHDWRARQASGPLEFDLRWTPFLNERQTPTADLTRAWRHDHAVTVGTVSFPRIDPETIDAKLTALLASELGANPGNWDETPAGPGSGLPATRFTAARHLVYRASQQSRNALDEAAYQSFFDRGEIGRALAADLVRRYEHKRAAGHWVPDVGEIVLP